MSPFRVTCKLARPNQPFWLNRPGQLAGNSEGAHGIFFSTLIFIYFFKYETIVSRNGLSLGYSERDTSSVLPHMFKLLLLLVSMYSYESSTVHAQQGIQKQVCYYLQIQWQLTFFGQYQNCKKRSWKVLGFFQSVQFGCIYFFVCMNMYILTGK